MSWLEVNVVTDQRAAEAVAETLRPFAHGDAVALEQLGDPDDLTLGALLPEVTVKVYLPAKLDSPQLRGEITDAVSRIRELELGPVSAPRFHPLEEKDWAHAWKAHYHPFRVGKKLWIRPSWWTEPLPPEATAAGATVLTLDPGMAFGTGLHQTTRLCLELLEERLEPGMRLLDLGTGSGILAIAAAQLGAGEVLASDTDPLAVQAARENVAANGVSGQVQVISGSLREARAGRDAPWDLVVVNILAPVIEQLLREEALLAAADRLLILSGIIAAQEAMIIAAVAAAGGTVVEIRHLDEWLAFVVAP